MKSSEEALRSILKKIQYQEELAHVKAEYERELIKETDPDEERLTSLKEAVEAAYEKNGLKDNEQ